MRDESMDAPIPDEFKPSNWNVEQLEEARRNLAKIESWDDARAEAEAEKVYREDIRHRDETITKNADLRQRYENMLSQVQSWTPPTSDHEELKKFMIQQLESSIDFDCRYVPERPKHLTGAEYKTQQIAEAHRNIEYHRKEHREEVKRAKERTDWVRALRGSLPVPSSR